MKLKKVKTAESCKVYKVNIKLNSYYKNQFCVGDSVISKRDNSKGKISKIKNNTIFVEYADKTIERFDQLNASNYLDYVDDIQDVIAPLTSQISLKEKAKKSHAKIKASEKLSEKEKHIEDIINLGIKKGIIQNDEFELEKLKCNSMSDEDFEDYENDIMNYKSSAIISNNDPNNPELEEMSEAERALYEIRNGKGSVSVNPDEMIKKFEGTSRAQTRSVSAVANTNPINSEDKIPTMPILNNVSNVETQKLFNKYSFLDEIDWTVLSSK